MTHERDSRGDMGIRRKVTRLYGSAASSFPVQLTALGDFLFSSSITGADPRTGALAEEPEKQFEQAFLNLERLLEQAGASPDDVGLVTVCIPGQASRPYINPPWVKLFPDETSRPARKTTQYPLPEGMVVQLQAVGVHGAARQQLEIQGLSHKDPLPMGVRLGNTVFTSVLGGQASDTGQQADGAEAQVRQVFANLETLVQQAGGTLDDVVWTWVYLQERGDQDVMIEQWLRSFPRDGDRPARKTFFYDELRGRATRIQLQAIAALEPGARQNYEVPGVGHHDPIPMAASRGTLLFSSGIGGRSPETNELGQSLEEQARLAFANLRALMLQTGGTLDNVGHLTLLVKDYASMAVVQREWEATFPDPSTQPSRHVMRLGLPGDNLLQLHLIGVL